MISVQDFFSFLIGTMPVIAIFSWIFSWLIGPRLESPKKQNYATLAATVLAALSYAGWLADRGDPRAVGALVTIGLAGLFVYFVQVAFRKRRQNRD